MPGPGPASRRRLLLNGFRFSFAFSSSYIRFRLRPWWSALQSSRLLRHESGPAKGAKGAGLVVVAAYYGDEALLQSFVSHHRRLGVAEFALLDLSKEGGLSQRLADNSGVAVWRPRGQWRGAQVQHWLNFLRRPAGDDG